MVSPIIDLLRRLAGAICSTRHLASVVCETENKLIAIFHLCVLGAQIDDSEGFKKGTRVSKPPGGESHGTEVLCLPNS